MSRAIRRREQTSAEHSAGEEKGRSDCSDSGPSEACAGPGAARERVARRAREIWEGRGRPVGQDLDIWLCAEREIDAAAN